MERNSAKKLSFTKLAQPLWSLWRPLHSTLSSFLFRGMVQNGIPREFASFFVSRNGILICFLFPWRVRKRIPRVFFYFRSMERNSELLSFPLKGSEKNSERQLSVGFVFYQSSFVILYTCSFFLTDWAALQSFLSPPEIHIWSLQIFESFELRGRNFGQIGTQWQQANVFKPRLPLQTI